MWKKINKWNNFFLKKSKNNLLILNWFSILSFYYGFVKKFQLPNTLLAYKMKCFKKKINKILIFFLKSNPVFLLSKFWPTRSHFGWRQRTQSGGSTSILPFMTKEHKTKPLNCFFYRIQCFKQQHLSMLKKMNHVIDSIFIVFHSNISPTTSNLQRLKALHYNKLSQESIH